LWPGAERGGGAGCTRLGIQAPTAPSYTAAGPLPLSPCATAPSEAPPPCSRPLPRTGLERSARSRRVSTSSAPSMAALPAPLSATASAQRAPLPPHLYAFLESSPVLHRHTRAAVVPRPLHTPDLETLARRNHETLNGISPVISSSIPVYCIRWMVPRSVEWSAKCRLWRCSIHLVPCCYSLLLHSF
jgi:hypothetical protein